MTYTISSDGSEQTSGCSDDPTIKAILNSQKINQNRVLEISFDGVSKARWRTNFFRISGWVSGGPEGIRTLGRPIKSRTLYLAELQAHESCWYPAYT